MKILDNGESQRTSLLFKIASESSNTKSPLQDSMKHMMPLINTIALRIKDGTSSATMINDYQTKRHISYFIELTNMKQ